ncbi:chemotaxis protein methyltransferase CheR [Fibrisoma limi BUZ 3]|uniref:Chemotaxis protein methyltransferase CheR n=1 Tax=Fibrisoma limi BUZ 3 TaxID=1185876 RepID=I2GJ77_9BACT|nr:chemotaxis protein CheB [Fibrisoma limi]CCH53952.1 chemotaxis protein methyltransferase CheR [Fibrisoma limi BUZ 3]
MAQDPSSADNQPSGVNAVPVVAIGASAGGIEAVSDLLRNLSPTTGLAYVYIQHLDPDYDSQLASILGRATTMPVLRAEEHLRIEPNHVYVIPPNQDMEIIDGVLTLSPRRNKSFLHMPIDQFFISLAERQKDGSIAVVLSGTATDGTLGLRAIKVAGGVTFAQDESAQFQSMPKSAIAEGVVDMILSPAEIAKELERLSRHPQIFQQRVPPETDLGIDSSMPDKIEQEDIASVGPTTSDEDIKAIIQILRRAIGVDFNHYKITTVRRRIIRRMLLFKLESLKDYAQYLKQHVDEIRLLYNDLLINVTTFFRDDDLMDYLGKVLFPRLIKEKAPRESIRIWVPACSTGQEAYSLAMLLLEVLGEQGTNRTIQIFATDLSEGAIAKARQGSYTRGEVMDVSPRRLQRFFTKVDDHYRINRNVRDLCVFAPHNLLKDPPFSRLDLVSCRNLLIYLDNVFQQKAIATFHYGLNPSGYLVLGKSETVGASGTLFVQLEKNYKIYTRRNDVASRAVFEMSPRSSIDGTSDSSQSEVIPAEGLRKPAQPAGSVPTGDLEQIVDGILLQQYVPASVVVNQDLDILQFRGSTSLFLEPAPGRASLNLLKMARPSLVFELRNSVFKARKSGQPVQKTGLEVKIKDKTHYVAIEAVPLNTQTEDQLFLILFEEITPSVPSAMDLSDSRNRRIKQLEEELAILREDMRSIIEEQEASNEELQSANEEIISSNEELQSINEELETSKEEIESTNEELLTINQELQVRNDQLAEANDFSEAIFGTIREATLVLDEDLRIKSANKAFYRLFKVNEDETEGRLIYELGGRQWDILQLRELLKKVVENDAQFQSFELTYSFPEIGDKTLSLNARRVVRQQAAILLAIDDVTEQRQARRLLEEREAWFRNITDNAPTLIWVADTNGRYTYVNKAWLGYTGRSLDDVLQQGWEQGLHPDDQDGYTTIREARFHDRQASQANYRLRQHDGAYRWMLENAQPTFNTDGSFMGFIGTAVDIHLQKELNSELEQRVQQRTAELQESNDLLQSVFDITPVAISFLKPVRLDNGQLDDFDIVLASGVTGQYANQTDITGKRYAELFPDARETGLFRRFGDVLETGTLADFEVHTTQENQDRWCHYAAVKLGDGLVVISQDITNSKRAEQEIMKNFTLMQHAEELARMGSWDYDRATGNFTWSEGMYRLFDMPPGTEVVPETYLEYVIPDDEPVAHRIIDFIKEGEGTLNDVLRIKGAEHIKTFRIKANIAGNGRARVLGIDVDITDMQQAEDKIRQVAEHLQAVLNNSPASIAFTKAVFDDQGQVIDFRLLVCNQKFADMVGLPIADLIGKPISELTDALWETDTFNNLLTVLTTEQPMYLERYNQGTHEGRWTGISISKEDTGIVLSGLDITSLKQAEQQQEQLMSQLKDSNVLVQEMDAIRQQIRQRGEFLRQTSHDLRGSFGVISGAAMLLNLMNSDEERNQMLSMLQRNVRQVTQMLSHLLDYSRLEAGLEEVHITSFDAAQLLRELSESLRPIANEKQLTLTIDGPDELRVESDEVKVQRIAQNLLLNAINHTSAGEVSLFWQTGEQQGSWSFIIQDTGPGLPAAVIEQLTDQQATPLQEATTGARDKSGEGIGLFIVKQLSRLLGARITIQSEEETGTRFQIDIPGPSVGSLS